jgi:hypothetical protein
MIKTNVFLFDNSRFWLSCFGSLNFLFLCTGGYSRNSSYLLHLIHTILCIMTTRKLGVVHLSRSQILQNNIVGLRYWFDTIKMIIDVLCFCSVSLYLIYLKHLCLSQSRMTCISNSMVLLCSMIWRDSLLYVLLIKVELLIITV